jgi:hypothetical protein
MMDDVPKDQDFPEVEACTFFMSDGHLYYTRANSERGCNAGCCGYNNWDICESTLPNCITYNVVYLRIPLYYIVYEHLYLNRI